MTEQELVAAAVLQNTILNYAKANGLKSFGILRVLTTLLCTLAVRCGLSFDSLVQAVKDEYDISLLAATKMVDGGGNN